MPSLKNAGQGLLIDDYLCLKIEGWLISSTVPITHLLTDLLTTWNQEMQAHLKIAKESPSGKLRSRLSSNFCTWIHASMVDGIMLYSKYMAWSEVGFHQSADPLKASLSLLLLPRYPFPHSLCTPQAQNMLPWKRYQALRNTLLQDFWIKAELEKSDDPLNACLVNVSNSSPAPPLPSTSCTPRHASKVPRFCLIF